MGCNQAQTSLKPLCINIPSRKWGKTNMFWWRSWSTKASKNEAKTRQNLSENTSSKYWILQKRGNLCVPGRGIEPDYVTDKAETCQNTCKLGLIFDFILIQCRQHKQCGRQGGTERQNGVQKPSVAADLGQLLGWYYFLRASIACHWSWFPSKSPDQFWLLLAIHILIKRRVYTIKTVSATTCVYLMMCVQARQAL